MSKSRRTIAALLGAAAVLHASAPAARAAVSCTTPAVSITHAQDLAYNAHGNSVIRLDAAKYPQARCNDGTMGAYALRLGVNSTRWVFHLEEGGYCNDAASCRARRQQDTLNVLTSSVGMTKLYANTTLWGLGVTGPGAINASNSPGLLSPVAQYNPDFWDANVVEVFYCSSDHYEGGYSPGPAHATFDPADPTTWYFQGRAIAEAVVRDVVARPEFAGATDALWTGSSAGGAGTVATVGDIAPLIPRGIRLVAMMDAGFDNDLYPSFDPDGAAPDFLGPTNPTLFQTMHQQSDATWHGRGDRACDAQMDAAHRLRCYDPSFVLSHGFIHTPIQVVQAELDTIQLGYDGIANCQMTASCAPGSPEAATQRQATSYMQGFMANALTPFATSLSPNVSTVFVADLQHVLTDNQEWLAPVAMPGGGSRTVASLVGAFYRDPCPRAALAEAGSPAPR